MPLERQSNAVPRFEKGPWYRATRFSLDFPWDSLDDSERLSRDPRTSLGHDSILNVILGEGSAYASEREACGRAQAVLACQNALVACVINSLAMDR